MYAVLWGASSQDQKAPTPDQVRTLRQKTADLAAQKHVLREAQRGNYVSAAYVGMDPMPSKYRPVSLILHWIAKSQFILMTFSVFCDVSFFIIKQLKLIITTKFIIK